MLFQGVYATGAGKIGCSVTGLPGAPVRGITLRDVALEFAGGGTQADAARDIAELHDKYPEYSMFGTLPSYGIFFRHARDVTADNLRLSWKETDLRPALVFDDVDGLDLSGLHPQVHAEAAAAIRLKDVRNASVRYSRLREGPRVFAEITGKTSGRISFAGVSVREGADVFRTDPGVSPQGITSRP